MDDVYLPVLYELNVECSMYSYHMICSSGLQDVERFSANSQFLSLGKERGREKKQTEIIAFQRKREKGKRRKRRETY